VSSNSGLGLVIVPIAVVIALAYFLIAYALRGRMLARLAALAPGQYVATFASNAWYQSVMLELQRQEIVDPAIPSDDTKPTNGPHWISASSTGLSIWRAYEDTPLVTLPWSAIGPISAELLLRRGSRNGSVPSLSTQLQSKHGELHLVLLSVNPRQNPLVSLGLAGVVAAELERLRSAAVSDAA
jgi:hypothetical protein